MYDNQQNKSCSSKRLRLASLTTTRDTKTTDVNTKSAVFVPSSRLLFIVAGGFTLSHAWSDSSPALPFMSSWSVPQEAAYRAKEVQGRSAWHASRIVIVIVLCNTRSAWRQRAPLKDQNPGTSLTAGTIGAGGNLVYSLGMTGVICNNLYAAIDCIFKLTVPSRASLF
jgi:hypothetical protein